MIRSNNAFSLVAATTVNRNVHDNHDLVLNLSAGFTVTLPKATGSGAKYRFINGTASNAYIISAVSAAATFVGGYLQGDSGDSAAAEVDLQQAVAGNNVYSPTTAGGGGLVGDWIEFRDIASNVYSVFGTNLAVTDPTNRFSTT